MIFVTVVAFCCDMHVLHSACHNFPRLVDRDANVQKIEIQCKRSKHVCESRLDCRDCCSTSLYSGSTIHASSPECLEIDDKTLAKAEERAQEVVLSASRVEDKDSMSDVCYATSCPP